MKKTIFTLLALIYIQLTAQNLDKCGLDSNSTLSQAESEFLNTYLSAEQKNGVDLTGKKVLFVTGPANSIIANKVFYFDDLKERQEHDYNSLGFVHPLTKSEQITSGYDIIISFWTKIALTKRRKKKLIKQVAK